MLGQVCKSLATQISEQVVAPSPPTQFITIDSDDELVELDEIDPVYVEADDIEEESEASSQHYTNNNDLAKDMLQRIDMMEEYKQMLAEAAKHLRGKEYLLRLARRAELPETGRPQSFTGIRKLHKRSDVHKERAKRHKTDDDLPHVQQVCKLCVCV
ncbi:unnamed protein product [Cylicostephanus goldi]|uniref:Uncharacterized protein n=1 Tax=Cylicostephanus goldi TaxID=71465 RepID=A0A3P7N9B5_CYLGO|nr:unnamed protein product [Cylicostephanus goldi]